MAKTQEKRAKHVEKAPTDIEGFDRITGGGLPRERTTLVLGEPGAGKTVFALQTLVNGARREGEPGIFVAFEENARSIVENSASFGWDIPALEKEHLFFLDARLPVDDVQTGPFDLTGLLAGLKSKVKQMGARRIVFDGIDVLLALLSDPSAERREFYRLREWLSAEGLTGIITAKEVRNGAELPHRYDFLPFLADCTVRLEHHLSDRTSLRSLRVLKYRGSTFAENEVPMIIGSEGIDAVIPSTRSLTYKALTERVSTGVSELDAMLDGGYLQGSSILLTGTPGTAKSTLSGTFLEAACLRGEKALLVCFDESGDEMMRNLASVGIHLKPHRSAGRLYIYSVFTDSCSPEEHWYHLQKIMQNHKPSCMVVDPLSALLREGGPAATLGVARRIISFAKNMGVTLLCTSLLQNTTPKYEGTDLQVSTIADTWIHLSYHIQAGERNRALTIIKSRGTAHSSQVREMILSNSGLTLASPYTEGGEVLMGTLRWEKEEDEARQRERIAMEVERKRRELEHAEADMKARMDELSRELDFRRNELLQLEASERDRLGKAVTKKETLRQKRGGAKKNASKRGRKAMK